MNSHIHIDPGCLLYGEIGLIPLSEKWKVFDVEIGNRSLWAIGLVFCGVVIGTVLFYGPLLVTSFDSTLAKSMGIPVKATHMGLMLALALSTVASLEAVGVILVVAMFVFPPVTAAFFLQRARRSHAPSAPRRPARPNRLLVEHMRNRVRRRVCARRGVRASPHRSRSQTWPPPSRAACRSHGTQSGPRPAAGRIHRTRRRAARSRVA
mgnify:CR=1 FL=1